MNNTDISEVWCTLTGDINQDMTQRVFNSFAHAVREKVDTVHLLIQSGGGFVSNGVALYNYLSGLPIKIIAYNPGGVLSIAVIVFLSAQKRVASDTATFMIHKSHVSPEPGATADALNAIADSLNIDNDRIETILRQHITMPKKMWDQHKHGNLTITARKAKELGLIHEIGLFSPPQGAKLYNI